MAAQTKITSRQHCPPAGTSFSRIVPQPGDSRRFGRFASMLTRSRSKASCFFALAAGGWEKKHQWAARAMAKFGDSSQSISVVWASVSVGPLPKWRPPPPRNKSGASLVLFRRYLHGCSLVVFRPSEMNRRGQLAGTSHPLARGGFCPDLTHLRTEPKRAGSAGLRRAS